MLSGVLCASRLRSMCRSIQNSEFATLLHLLRVLELELLKIGLFKSRRGAKIASRCHTVSSRYDIQMPLPQNKCPINENKQKESRKLILIEDISSTPILNTDSIFFFLIELPGRVPPIRFWQRCYGRLERRGGDISQNFWLGGVQLGPPNPDRPRPYFRPKYTIFGTLFRA